ncbi:hypothetical protein E2C01_041337 [Portunus trituberculatus]|uniref:Uncharacterized protein n=1 Tax=Portunus trituberculatus TaxID=210409 RepID=A0A5B7FQ58_PORTR|nr:hypothetical protein [Portunus trituberculatus]
MNVSIECPRVGGSVTLDVWPGDIQHLKVMNGSDKESKIHQAENSETAERHGQRTEQAQRNTGLGMLPNQWRGRSPKCFSTNEWRLQCPNTSCDACWFKTGDASHVDLRN